MTLEGRWRVDSDLGLGIEVDEDTLEDDEDDEDNEDGENDAN